MGDMLKIGSHAQVELLTGSNDEFLGIGAVTVDGTPLRSTHCPITIRLDTPDGVLYPVLHVREVLPGDNQGEWNIRLWAEGVRWGRGEYADDYGQPLYWLADGEGTIEDCLDLFLRSVQLDLGGRGWRGFSYEFRFRSGERQIHRLLTHATWEIGGSITGNTVLSQGQCNMPVYRGSAETLFTTACLRSLDRYGSPQGNSFQLGPRAGLIQGFDFHYSPAGALLQFWPELGSISSLLESPPDSDLLHVVDEYRFPLAKDVNMTPKWVLFTPGPLAEHEARDLWWAAQNHVYGGIRDRCGIAPTVVVPEVGLKYATRVHEGRLRVSIAGEEVDSAAVPYAIAERVLPRLAKQGIRRFFPEVMSESDVTVLGMKRKLDDGVHSDLHCASVCATHRFFPSEFWGGIRAWRVMAEKARALGIQLGAWFAPHFSPRAPIFQQHPEYRMTDVTGMAAGGGYGFQTIVVGDWNTGLFDWVLDDLKRWKGEGGLDYLFTDSLSNMGLLQMNYAGGMRTNWDALGRLYGEIQNLGIQALSFECVSAFGVGRFGLADPRGDLLPENRAVAGQNDFGWWVGEEDMAFGLCLVHGARGRSPQELERIAFRLLSNRGCAIYEHEFGLDHVLPEWWENLNHIYNQALPHMVTRHLLPGEDGVRWESGDTQIIWAYRDLPIQVPVNARVERLDKHGSTRVTAEGEIVRLGAWSVYRLS